MVCGVLSVIQQKTTRESKSNLLLPGSGGGTRLPQGTTWGSQHMVQAERVEQKLRHILLLGPKGGVLWDSWLRPDWSI